MRRTQQQWLALFQAQNDSILSIKNFCLEQNISPSSFYKHKAISKGGSDVIVPSPFSQVQVIEATAFEPQNQTIELNIGNVKLTLERKINVDWLVNIVRQLA